LNDSFSRGVDVVRIAISGKSGCGNSTVSRVLAERLGVRLINYTFRSIAREEGVSFEEIRAMAEASDRWDRHLDRRQVQLAMEGSCVLGSRLAIWMLEAADLRVYLDASVETRAGRIHRREGGRYEDVLAATIERDNADRARYRRLYDIDIDAFDFADLLVDTERARPAAIVERIHDTLVGAGIVSA
jgi:cytidylate kinase